MRVRLAQGRVARARRAREHVDDDDSIIDNLGKWPPDDGTTYYILYWEEGLPHLVDVDASVEWDGWTPNLDIELDQLEGGAL